MKITKSDISLELECWVEDLSAAQLSAYEKVASEHNAIKGALKTALTANEGKELFNGEVFQAYSFKGKVLQELKEATLPPKKIKEAAVGAENQKGRSRKRGSNLLYLESSDEEDDVPLAKRLSMSKKVGATGQGSVSSNQLNASKGTVSKKGVSSSGKASPQIGKGKASSKNEKEKVSTSPKEASPSEHTAIGGLVIESDSNNKEKPEIKEANKETKLQGKTFPSLVVLAKPSLKVKDMSATRAKLDSKVKLVLMLTSNKFTEWLLQEGLLKAEQQCGNHRNSELKLGKNKHKTTKDY